MIDGDGGGVVVVILCLQNCIAFLFVKLPWKYQMEQSGRQNLSDKTAHAFFS